MSGSRSTSRPPTIASTGPSARNSTPTCALVHHRGEGLDEVKTVGQHDQHSITGTHVDSAQRCGDCDRLVAQLQITHHIATVINDFV
jgi:hypothetical protein